MCGRFVLLHVGNTLQTSSFEDAEVVQHVSSDGSLETVLVLRQYFHCLVLVSVLTVTVLILVLPSLTGS